MVYMMDDFIDACTRPTYGQPVEDIHLNYQPIFGRLKDFRLNLGSRVKVRGESGD
jgi:hypothetical protein